MASIERLDKCEKPFAFAESFARKTKAKASDSANTAALPLNWGGQMGADAAADDDYDDGGAW